MGLKDILFNRKKAEEKEEIKTEAVHQEKPTRQLTESQAEPCITSVRQPTFSDSVAYTLTPNKLYSIVQELKNGDLRAYMTMAEEFELKDAHYRSVIGTRKSQVVSLNCHVTAADDEQKSLEIAEAVEKYILKAPWFEDMKSDLLDGLGKGYSVCEIMWEVRNGMWIPADVVWRDPRYFRYDRKTMSHLVLDEAGAEIELYANKYIIHEPKLKSGMQLLSGLALPCAYYQLIKHTDIAGWAALAQVYGYPMRIGRYGRNASASDKKILRKAISQLGSDCGAILPEAMKVEIINGITGNGNITLYENLAEFCDKQVSKCVLGQTMSTDAEGGQYKGDLHNEIRLELKKSDAKALAKTIQRDLVIPFVNFNFGVQEWYPELCIPVPEPEDVGMLLNGIRALVPMGFKVRMDDLYSKFNLTKPDEGDDCLKAPEGFPLQSVNRMQLNAAEGVAPVVQDEYDRLEDEELGDWADIMEPLMQAMKKMLSECGSFEEFISRLPELEKEFDTAPGVVEKLTLSMFKARALGASEAL